MKTIVEIKSKNKVSIESIQILVRDIMGSIITVRELPQAGHREKSYENSKVNDWKCPNCGTKNRFLNMECHCCGQPIPAEADDKNLCAVCGRPNHDYEHRFQRIGCHCELKGYASMPICDNFRSRNSPDYPDICECGHHKSCHEQEKEKGC